MFTNEFSLNLATVANLTALVTAINTAASWNTGVVGVTASLNGSNQLVLTSANSNGFSLTSLGATAQETTTGLGFSHYFGLNDFFTSSTRLIQDGNVLGRLGISNVIDVRSDIVINDRILSTGKLSATTPLPLTPLTRNIGITEGDGTILQAMNDKLLDTTQSFATAGYMPATTTTFLDYTSLFLSKASERAAENEQKNDFNKQLFVNLQGYAKEVSGVNRDEELTKLVMYESAYQASARVISTVTALLDALNQIKT
jgi:flagellar hook-associated protein 1 FlgK